MGANDCLVDEERKDMRLRSFGCSLAVVYEPGRSSISAMGEGKSWLALLTEADVDLREELTV